ncbi:Putative transporter svop-1 [Durusdinium trenchii]|uniref:Transporter svop-1 n=1 Tax=Durusdinium trenchii TaxID=1381693 RepID=A0ABP0RHZ3_9DINO
MCDAVQRDAVRGTSGAEATRLGATVARPMISFAALGLVPGQKRRDGEGEGDAGSISTILATDWDLSPLQQGVLLSSVYVGVLMGNLMSGWVGDRLGRRSAVLLSFPIIALLSVASSLANGFWVLLPLRYFVGFGFGLGQPSAIAILMEVSPGRYRPLNQALAQIAFALGELYCCLVMWFDDPRMIHLHWRTLLVANAVPAVLFWLASWAQLQESPVFSAINGKPEEAHEALDKMRRLNGKPDHSIDFAEASAGVSAVPEQGRLSQLPPGRTAALCIVCFCYNITIYGAFTAFPQLIPRLLNQETQSAALQLAQGAALDPWAKHLWGLQRGPVWVSALSMQWTLFGRCVREKMDLGTR